MSAMDFQVAIRDGSVDVLMLPEQCTITSIWKDYKRKSENCDDLSRNLESNLGKTVLYLRKAVLLFLVNERPEADEVYNIWFDTSGFFRDVRNGFHRLEKGFCDIQSCLHRGCQYLSEGSAESAEEHFASAVDIADKLTDVMPGLEEKLDKIDGGSKKGLEEYGRNKIAELKKEIKQLEQYGWFKSWWYGYGKKANLKKEELRKLQKEMKKPGDKNIREAFHNARIALKNVRNDLQKCKDVLGKVETATKRATEKFKYAKLIKAGAAEVVKSIAFKTDIVHTYCYCNVFEEFFAVSQKGMTETIEFFSRDLSNEPTMKEAEELLNDKQWQEDTRTWVRTHANSEFPASTPPLDVNIQISQDNY